MDTPTVPIQVTVPPPIIPPTPIPSDVPMSLPPTTTAQEDVTTAGQRKINLIWEWTQAVIAVLVTGATMVGGVLSQMTDKPFPLIIGVAFGTITGFYFSRTNHQAIGGIGTTPSQPYIGR